MSEITMIRNKPQTNSGGDGLKLTPDTALKVPLIECESQSLVSAYALIPKNIFPLLSRFLLRHDLNFKLASLPGEAFPGKYLLCLSCKDKSLELAESIPDFILTYIKNLPFCHLFQGFSGPGKESLFFCEYGFKYTLALAELVAETTAAGLYISFAGECSGNTIIRPVPEFLPESSVLQYEVDFPLQQFDQIVQAGPEKLLLPLKLIDCKTSFSGFAPVLFLEGKEIVWLREILYRLPGPLFTEIEWAGTKEYLFLFFNDSAGSTFFPFGQSFRKIAPNLFIPADKDIVPHLEPELLHKIFQVENDGYSFITDSGRRDLPLSIKAPLSQLLTAVSELEIEFKSDSDLDGFLWEDPAVELEEDILLPAVEPSGMPGDSPVIPAFDQLASSGSVRTSGEGENYTAFIEQTFNDHGVLLRQQGDFLGAATCFSLAKKNLAAADCYAEAALALGVKHPKVIDKVKSC